MGTRRPEETPVIVQNPNRPAIIVLPLVLVFFLLYGLLGISYALEGNLPFLIPYLFLFVVSIVGLIGGWIVQVRDRPFQIMVWGGGMTMIFPSMSRRFIEWGEIERLVPYGDEGRSVPRKMFKYANLYIKGKRIPYTITYPCYAAINTAYTQYLSANTPEGRKELSDHYPWSINQKRIPWDAGLLLYEENKLSWKAGILGARAQFVYFKWLIFRLLVPVMLLYIALHAVVDQGSGDSVLPYLFLGCILALFWWMMESAISKIERAGFQMRVYEKGIAIWASTLDRIRGKRDFIPLGSIALILVLRAGEINVGLLSPVRSGEPVALEIRTKDGKKYYSGLKNAEEVVRMYAVITSIVGTTPAT